MLILGRKLEIRSGQQKAEQANNGVEQSPYPPLDAAGGGRWTPLRRLMRRRSSTRRWTATRIGNTEGARACDSLPSRRVPCMIPD